MSLICGEQWPQHEKWVQSQTSNKFKIEKHEKWKISYLHDIDVCESLYRYSYNGMLYNLFLQVETKERLSYEEYAHLVEHTISKQVYLGEITVTYSRTVILIISKFCKKSGKL
jgi:hypothetical protein